MNSFHMRVGLVGDFVFWIDGAAVQWALGMGYAACMVMQ